MSRVFVTNYAGHDLSASEKYGEVISLTRGYISFGSLDRVNYTIAEKLTQYNVTEDDYLLLSGISIICIMAAMIWYNKFKKVKLLVWDPPTKDYRLMEVNESLYETLLKEVSHEV